MALLRLRRDLAWLFSPWSLLSVVGFAPQAKRGTASSAAAPATRRRKFRRGSFISILPSLVPLFDYLIGDGQHAWRNGQTKRPGGLEVDDELELGRLLHRQIGRLGTFQYFVHVAGSTTIQVRIVRSVSH